MAEFLKVAAGSSSPSFQTEHLKFNVFPVASCLFPAVYGHDSISRDQRITVARYSLSVAFLHSFILSLCVLGSEVSVSFERRSEAIVFLFLAIRGKNPGIVKY